MALLRRDIEQSALYDEIAHTWWDEDGVLHALQVLLAPVRLPFVTQVLAANVGPGRGRILDLGFKVFAVDPSVQSLHAGKVLGSGSRQTFARIGGSGVALPFAGASCWYRTDCDDRRWGQVG